jgi:hypothetical protein
VASSVSKNQKRLKRRDQTQLSEIVTGRQLEVPTGSVWRPFPEPLQSQRASLPDINIPHEMPAHSARSLIPISRAELAMTGMEESSCKSAPVTGERMPGMASPTAIASTLNEKIRFCLMARIA